MDVSTFDDSRALPPPLGFDPEPHYGTIHGNFFGLLRFTPWRVELGNLGGEPIIWRPLQDTCATA